MATAIHSLSYIARQTVERRARNSIGYKRSMGVGWNAFGKRRGRHGESNEEG